MSMFRPPYLKPPLNTPTKPPRKHTAAEWALAIVFGIVVSIVSFLCFIIPVGGGMLVPEVIMAIIIGLIAGYAVLYDGLGTTSS